MKRITFILLLTFVFSQNVFCQEIGKIISTQGRVDIFKEGCQSAIPAKEDESVSIGDSIRTKSGSKAQVVFNDKSILKLAQNSKVSIRDYQFDEKGGRKTALIELSRGKARAIIAKMRDSADFMIATPNAKGTVKGSDVTAFFQAGSSGMFVSEGKLSVISLAHPDNKITVPAGNACVVPLGELPKGPRPYLDVEKKLNEEDTYVPVSISKTGKVSVIKGAVAKVSGVVKIISKNTGQARNAGINDILGEGDRVETGENGYMEIRLDNNNAINLKPNTKLTIIKLVINPETGEFENIFEVMLGQIKARIENLKGSSKFEVKTPQAVCGARGTIIYVSVTQNSTTSFFEGGNGYLTNTLTNATQEVPPGTSSSTDYTGNVSNPTHVSDTDRQSLSEGWDPGAGTEGYSTPEGNAGAGVVESGAGANASGNAGTTGITDTSTNNTTDGTPPADVPFTEPPIVKLETPPPSAPDYTLEGDTTHESGVDYAVFASAEPVWGSSADIVFVGAYQPEQPSGSLWKFHTIGHTGDNSAIYGMAGGTNVNNILKGLLYAIYIKPDPVHPGQYITGYLKSPDITGFRYSDLNLFYAYGSLTAVEMGQTAVTPAQLSAYMSNDVFGDRNQPVYRDDFSGNICGDIAGAFNGESIRINHSYNDQMWNIWRSESNGTYQALPQSGWQAVFGNTDTEFGDIGYTIGHISGSAWSGNEFTANLTGKEIWYSPSHFSISTLGSITGEAIGTYADNTWKAINAGVTDEKPLKIGGAFNGGFGSHIIDDLPDLILDLKNTRLSGIIGGIDSPWEGNAPITIMGKFNNPLSYSLWASNDDLMGKTSDGGAILGALGGVKINNYLKGIFAGFYIRPNPSGSGYLCGYLLSNDITGEFYPDIGMLESTGHLDLNKYLDAEQSTTVKPEELYEGSNKIETNDTSIGMIIGPGFSGSLRPETANISDQNWSLWRASCGGTYLSVFPTGSWSARMGGGSFDEDTGQMDSYWIGALSGITAGQVGEFSGTVDVTVLDPDSVGNSRGDLIGVYDSGIWQALSVGVYIETAPLSSSGRFVAQGWNLGEGSTFDFAGLIGLVGSIWGSESRPDFISMGEFTPPDVSNPDKQFAWYAQKEWYRYPSGELAGEDGFVSRYRDYNNPSRWHYTTYNDGSGAGNGIGSFYGLSVGVGGSGALKGKIYSLYIDPLQNAGVIYGDIDGEYYADIKMYEMRSPENGGLTKNFHNYVSVLPADLRDNISWDTLSGLDDHGGFDTEYETNDIYANGGSGTMLNITGQNWGVWNLVTGGTFQGTTSDAWNIYDLTGTTTAKSEGIGGAWLGGIDGTKWSDNKIDGTVNAIWIQLHENGTLSGRTLSSSITGNYIEAPGEGGNTWQAVSAGEWVEADSLLDTTNLSTLANDVIALGPLGGPGGVPITVAYSGLMSGPGSFSAGGAINVLNFNMNFYHMAGGGDGIWAAIVNGNYTAPTSSSWTANVTGNLLDSSGNPTGATVSAQLNGTHWSGDHWAANVVNGSASNGAVAFSGVAAGTYNNSDHYFEGAGTGTYTEHKI